MDVICVQDAQGVYHYTEFYVRFRSLLIDSASLAFVGLGNESLVYPAQSASHPTTPPSSIHSLADEDIPGIDVIHDRTVLMAITEEDRPPIPPSEPAWVSIVVNGNQVPYVKAYIGLNQLLHFFDPDSLTSTITPNQRDFLRLGVKKGRNKVTVYHPPSGCEEKFEIYVYTLQSNLIIMDIDGTITRSDLKGYIHTVYLGLYHYVHAGIVEFLHTLSNTFHVNFVYLTSRPIGHRKETLSFLKGVRGGEHGELTLPPGPLFTAKSKLMVALYREVITKKTAFIKSSILLQMREVFLRAGDKRLSPFVLGWGNKENDARAYRSVSLPAHQIFIINTNSKIQVYKDPAQSSNNISSSASRATTPPPREVKKSASLTLHSLFGMGGTAAPSAPPSAPQSQPSSPLGRKKTLSPLYSPSPPVLGREGEREEGRQGGSEGEKERERVQKGEGETEEGGEEWTAGGEFRSYSDPLLLQYIAHLLKGIKRHAQENHSNNNNSNNNGSNNNGNNNYSSTS